MALKVYVDRMSQPSRAILLLCKVNGIEFEEVKIELAKSEHRSSEFAGIACIHQVPAIVHGDFKLFESHAILIYVASAFPGVADHWYPADVQKRAKIHSVLDWHHSNLRQHFLLEKDVSFRNVVDEEDRDRILGPHKRILKWIENVRNATGPYFDELHSILLHVREKLKERRSKLLPNYEEENTKHWMDFS
ncbi:glutathione S-transferase T1-like [Primulina tabacum]|uniref:glutathione S-transferase T1-like n=1 Tax=Primulina tabacum TaxID=48773 RepID=UPI003F5A7B91